MTDMVSSETTAKKENLKFSENGDGKGSSRLKGIMNGPVSQKTMFNYEIYVTHMQ